MLLDANMPVMDGFDLAAKVQQSPRLAGASIMMLSSGARPGDRARCFELGISAYLTKPVKQSDLMDTIMGVLVSRSEERKARPRKEAARLPPGGRRLRVLVAEDNAVNQQVAAGMLERAGHEAVVAANGREALALLEQRGVRPRAHGRADARARRPRDDGRDPGAGAREGRASPHRGGDGPRDEGRRRALPGGGHGRLRGEAAPAAGAGGRDREGRRPRGSGWARLRHPASASLPPAGVVDFPRLLERVGGDRKALAQLVRIFRADSPKQAARIRKAIESGDAPALRSAAHAVKGAVSNFAAPAATEAALRLQRMGDTGHLAGAEGALDRLEREIGRVLEALAEAAPGPPRRRSRPVRKPAAKPRARRASEAAARRRRTGSARRPRPPGRAAVG